MEEVAFDGDGGMELRIRDGKATMEIDISGGGWQRWRHNKNTRR
jgi:hypothetical protein